MASEQQIKAKKISTLGKYRLYKGFDFIKGYETKKEAIADVTSEDGIYFLKGIDCSLAWQVIGKEVYANEFGLLEF